MAKNKKVEISLEEKLEKALIPVEEQPYKLPDSWVWVRLGEVVEVNPNKIKIEIKAFVSAVYGLAMRNSSFVRVISPADLVKKIRDDVKNLSRMYGGV